MNADDVANAVFTKPPLGRFGYNEDEVDDFLDALASRLANPRDSTLDWITPDLVQNVTFGAPAIGMRGYNRDEVDEFLARCATQLEHLDDIAPAAAAKSTTQGFGCLTADDIEAIEFPKPLIARRGYNQVQVDEFLDAVADKFRDPSNPKLDWLTPTSIDEAVFGPASRRSRSYRKDYVDIFLARCGIALEHRLRSLEG